MIHFKKLPLKSIDDIYSAFKKSEFNSPFRSTIPLLVLYKNNQLPQLQPPDQLLTVTFEYETKVKKGRGLPSCTDLMLEYMNSCVAIESKWSEPPYESVLKWLGEIPNRKLVLEGWLEIISDHLKLDLDISQILDLPYQLIHRVASACSLHKKETHILYIAFDLDKKKEAYYLNSLTRFSNILKHKAHLHFYSYKIEKTERQKEIESYWIMNGERQLFPHVIEGLKKNNLMQIFPHSQTKISDIA